MNNKRKLENLQKTLKEEFEKQKEESLRQIEEEKNEINR